MKYKSCTDPQVFGFGIFIPDKFYPYILKYKKQVMPYVDWFVEKEDNPKRNLMRPHITLKYLGYHKKYTNQQIKKLIPGLKEVCKKFLPLKIQVKGITIGTKYSQVGVLLNFKPLIKIRKFHRELIKKMKNKLDIFKNMDGKNFNPHIVLGSGEKTPENVRKLKEIARKSKKDKLINIKMTAAYIYFKGIGPKRIYKKDEN